MTKNEALKAMIDGERVIWKDNSGWWDKDYKYLYWDKKREKVLTEKGKQYHMRNSCDYGWEIIARPVKVKEVEVAYHEGCAGIVWTTVAGSDEFNNHERSNYNEQRLRQQLQRSHRCIRVTSFKV